MKFKRTSFDPTTTIPVVLIIGVMVALLWIFPEGSEWAIGKVFGLVTDNLGWLFLLVDFILLILAIYLGVSKYGNIKLGNVKPEFSFTSWIAMLFSAAIAAGIVFYGTAEPILNYFTPPEFAGVDAASIESARFAMKQTFFHWGLNAWGIYVVIAIALAHVIYNLGQPLLISSTMYPIWGDKAYGARGKTIDILATFATLGGVATTLGLMIMQIKGGLGYHYGVEIEVGGIIAIGIVLEIAAIISLITGVHKGILYLSNLNMGLFFFMLLFVFITGPTLFMLDLGVSTVGDYILGVIPMSLFTDPFREAGTWLGGWTVFYWAWWFAWSPFVGLFIARISKGRKIRELVIGGLGITVFLTFMWYTVMGGSAIYFDFEGIAPIGQTISEYGTSVASFELLENLPIAFVTIPILLVVIGTFFITSSDSGSLAASMLNTRGMEEPPTISRLIWGSFEAVLGISLLVVGGMEALQTVSILVAVPFMVILMMMSYSLLRSLQTYRMNPEKIDMP